MRNGLGGPILGKQLTLGILTDYFFHPFNPELLELADPLTGHAHHLPDRIQRL